VDEDREPSYGGESTTSATGFLAAMAKTSARPLHQFSGRHIDHRIGKPVLRARSAMAALKRCRGRFTRAKRRRSSGLSSPSASMKISTTSSLAWIETGDRVVPEVEFVAAQVGPPKDHMAHASFPSHRFPFGTTRRLIRRPQRHSMADRCHSRPRAGRWRAAILAAG
jgi:hypothetical protein